MKLTATPFDPATGELLPVYRDAYLRGDLSRTSAQAVESYLRHDASEAHGTVVRWHELSTAEVTAPAPGWVRQQMRFIREQPQRMRRRAGVVMGLAALVAGASMASTMQPEAKLPIASVPISIGTALPASIGAALPATVNAARTVVVHGRVLDESGKPLVGATILRKGTAQGTSTDASGNYAMRVPADAATTLQYGYGGYAERELTTAQAGVLTAVSLQPREAAKHKRWWLF